MFIIFYFLPNWLSFDDYKYWTAIYVCPLNFETAATMYIKVVFRYTKVDLW